MSASAATKQGGRGAVVVSLARVREERTASASAAAIAAAEAEAMAAGALDDLLARLAEREHRAPGAVAAAMRRVAADAAAVLAVRYRMSPRELADMAGLAGCAAEIQAGVTPGPEEAAAARAAEPAVLMVTAGPAGPRMEVVADAFEDSAALLARLGIDPAAPVVVRLRGQG